MTAVITSLSAERARRAHRPGGAPRPATLPLARPLSPDEIAALDPAVVEIADVLLALEDAAAFRPLVATVRRPDGRCVVMIRAGERGGALEAEDAEALATCLRLDSAWPGCVEDADRIAYAASVARARNARLSMSPARRSGGGAGAVALSIAAVALGLALVQFILGAGL